MHAWYWNCIGITVAGGLGSLARYGLTELVETWFGKQFPYGTLTVNLVGCLLFGIVWASCARGVIGENARLILLVGFLGGFTTFSSFAFHNEQMVALRQWNALLINVLIQNSVGVFSVWLGIQLAHAVLPGAAVVK